MTAAHFVVPPWVAEIAATYVADGSGHDVVPVVLDGRTVLMAFELDAAEHARRLERSLGPVRSRGLLHALWALPEGILWPVSGLDQPDAETLNFEGHGHVTEEGGSINRVYRPAGQVRAIGLAARRLVDAVGSAGQFPPIFRRYALSTSAGRTDLDAVAIALTVGVGAAIARLDGLSVLAQAEPPKTGVPSVYRWWLAEVAYRGWLQTNAH